MKFKNGDIVKCTVEKGFATDSTNYLLKDKIKMDDILEVSLDGFKYGSNGEEGVIFINKTFTHPASSFELVEEDYKVGDTFTLPANSKLGNCRAEGETEYKVFSLGERAIHFERPSYSGFLYYKATKEAINKEKIKKETMTQKEIIGYKLKKDCIKYDEAAVKIIAPSDVESFKDWNHKGYYVGFTYTSIAKTKLEKAGILDLWFEPVYKNDKKQIENVGSNKVTLTLEDDGNTISIKGKSETLNLKEIKKFYELASKPFSFGLLNIENTAQSSNIYRVGCEKEDNRVSLNDIQRVIKAFS